MDCQCGHWLLYLLHDHFLLRIDVGSLYGHGVTVRSLCPVNSNILHSTVTLLQLSYLPLFATPCIVLLRRVVTVLRVHSKPIFHLLGRGCVLQCSSVHPWGHRQEIDELHELLNQSRAGGAHPGGAGNPNYPAELKLPPKRRPVRLGHQVWPPSLSLAQLRWDPENPMAVEGAAPSCLQFPIFWSRLLFAFGVRAISLGEQMQGGVLPTAPLPKPSLVGVRVDHPPHHALLQTPSTCS